MFIKGYKLTGFISTLLLVLFVFTLSASNTYAATRNVPADFATIQAAINASVNGDEIIVSPGTYNENLNLNKSVTIRASTYDSDNPKNNTAIINGGGNTVIIIPTGLNPGPSIIGFQLLNGGSDGIFPESPFTVEYNYFTGAGDLIDYEKGAGGINRFNFYENAGDDAIDLDHPVIDYLIEKNLILNSDDDGIEIRLQDDSIAEYPRVGDR